MLLLLLLLLPPPPSPNVGGVAVRSRKGAPSRKGCVVNGRMATASKNIVHPSFSSSPLPPNLYHAEAFYLF